MNSPRFFLFHSNPVRIPFDGSLLSFFQNYHFFITLLLQTVQRSKGKYYFYYSSTWNLQTWLRLNLRRLTPRHFPSSILKIGRPLPVNYISPGLSRGICPPILASWHFNQRLKGRFFFSPRCYRTRPTSFMYAQCISEEASRHTSAITSLDKATAYFPLATRLHLQANEIPSPRIVKPWSFACLGFLLPSLVSLKRTWLPCIAPLSRCSLKFT